MDGPAEVKDPSRTKVEVPKPEEEIPKEPSLGKTVMPREKVPIAKVGSSSTTEGSKEQPCKPKGEEEKMVFQELIRNLE